MVALQNKAESEKPKLCYAQSSLPTAFGTFQCMVYRFDDKHEHVALVMGEVSNRSSVLCRIQSECLTGEVFQSLRCDCKLQLDAALSAIAENGSGILLYLRQEGRGIGLGNKIRAYELQEQGADTVDANRLLGFPDDDRDFSCAIKIVRDLNVLSIKLLTNNPKKVDALIDAGIHVVERIPHKMNVSKEAQNYLLVKAARMGHYLGKKDKTEFDSIELDTRF